MSTHTVADTGDYMARKRSNYQARPPQGFVAGAPPDAIKAEFGRVLQKFMTEKNWNQSDLAREAAKHMADKRFSRDNVSQYVRGLTLPGPVRLQALAKALGKKPGDILPVRSTETIDQKAPPIDLRALGDGNMWLRVNQSVPQDVALKVLQLITGSDGGKK